MGIKTLYKTLIAILIFVYAFILSQCRITVPFALLSESMDAYYCQGLVSKESSCGNYLVECYLCFSYINIPQWPILPSHLKNSSTLIHQKVTCAMTFACLNASVFPPFCEDCLQFHRPNCSFDFPCLSAVLIAINVDVQLSISFELDRWPFQ